MFREFSVCAFLLYIQQDREQQETKWRMSAKGEVREKDSGDCPLVVVANRLRSTDDPRFRTSAPSSAARFLFGKSLMFFSPQWTAIAGAADNDLTFFPRQEVPLRVEIRDALIQATKPDVYIEGR